SPPYPRPSSATAPLTALGQPPHVWDVRKFKAPVKVFPDLPNHYQQTNVAWSPDERLFFTATSAEKGSRGGQLHFYSKELLDLVRVTGVSPDQTVVRVLWHARLNQVGAVARTPQPAPTPISRTSVFICPFPARNETPPLPDLHQIFATCGDKKAGGTHILYDPTLSERGALVCVARAPRAAIRNPHALPMFRDEPSRKRQREKAHKDPVASQRPDLPMEGPGHGGREGGLLKETWMEEDPREAILKYADAAAKDPHIISPAYAATQPTTLFHESDDEDQD
ncbi:unnamed protein product, partial [Closterium sp. Naga37s-1]